MDSYQPHAHVKILLFSTIKTKGDILTTWDLVYFPFPHMFEFLNDDKCMEKKMKGILLPDI